MTKYYHTAKNQSVGALVFVEFAHINDDTGITQRVKIPCVIHSHVLEKVEVKFVCVVPTGSDTVISVDPKRVFDCLC